MSKEILLCKVQIMAFDAEPVTDTFLCTDVQAVKDYVQAAMDSDSTMVYTAEADAIRYEVGEEQMRISWTMISTYK